MKNKLQRVIDDLLGFSVNEKLILVSVLALFLPFQYAAAAIGVILLYFIHDMSLIETVRIQRGAMFLYAFVFLEIIVSTVYSNWIGLLNSLGYLLGAVFIGYYRRIINPKLFNYMIHLYVFMSLFAAFYGLIEFWRISNKLGNNFWDFVVVDSPKYRINSTFKNANFYATMIDYFLIFCTYEFLRDKSLWKRVYVSIAAAINFFMLLLTGCRAALIPFIFIIPVFLWFDRKRKLFYTSVAAEAVGAGFIMANPRLIPRIQDISTVSSRIKIWQASLIGIREHFWFGRGPQTYGMLYTELHTKKAPHAHNIYLDSLLSFGAVGTALIAGYFISLLQEIFAIRNNKKVPLFFPMLICFILSALVHGIVDVTLNFLVTGLTFMMIINSACMFANKKTVKSAE